MNHGSTHSIRGTKTISFTSGKGGVGKTTMVINTAFKMAAAGKKVLILDGDLGMANVDVMMRVKSKYSIRDVLEGTKTLREIIVPIKEGVHLIPGGNGVYELCRISSLQKQALMSQVSELDREYDFMLIDTAPGIDDNVLYLNSAAQEINVVLTPDPSSLADAYALIKVLNKKMHEQRFSIICNQVKDETEGKIVFRRLFDVCSKFLFVSLDYRGSVPADPILRQSVRSHQVVSLSHSRAPSSLAIQEITQKMSGYQPIERSKSGLQFFWNQFVGVA